MKTMEAQPSDFVLIILKPAAAKDKHLTNYIYSVLSQYGQLKYIQESIRAQKSIISKHYQASKSSLWYPIITNYFTNKLVNTLILETPAHQDYYDSNGKKCAFATFLKQEIIGPADICKTKKHHIRRLARRKVSLLVDNLIHASDNNAEALAEIKLWYQDQPDVVAEFAQKVHNDKFKNY